MKAFNHINAKTLVEAKTALAGGKANLIAGGTDLIGLLKDNVLPTYPSTLINIKTIPGLDYIKEEAAIAGKPINEANAEAAGAAAVEDAKPLTATKYKVQIAKTLVKRALLATMDR